MMSINSKARALNELVCKKYSGHVEMGVTELSTMLNCYESTNNVMIELYLFDLFGMSINLKKALVFVGNGKYIIDNSIIERQIDDSIIHLKGGVKQ